MKQAMFTQTSACKYLRVVTVDIRQRLCVIEKPGTSGVAAPTPLAHEGNQAGGSWETSSRGSDSETPAPDRTTTAAMGATNANGAVVSPKWTRVVKEGRRLKHATGKSPMPKKTSGIVGTGIVAAWRRQRHWMMSNNNLSKSYWTYKGQKKLEKVPVVRAAAKLLEETWVNLLLPYPPRRRS
ncbi:unnamed protein product [Boreogadus saida]